MPLTVAVFLVVGFLLSGAWFLRKNGLIEERGVLGGPGLGSSILASAQGAQLGPSDAPMEPENTINTASGYPRVVLADVSSAVDAAMKDPGTPIGPAFDRSGTIAYTVRKGDNLSRIAAYFGVSVETIVSANPGVKANFLQAGQTLSILPTSGVIYRVRSGDTLESISENFGIPTDKIIQFNRSVNFASLDPGAPLIVPGGRATARLAGTAALPNFNREFIMPTNGYNWGILHHYNAVDIANSCGTPVTAAAEGLVVPDESTPNAIDGWNGGYGNFVLIEHPFGNNVRTRYAHLKSVSVQIGDYVKRGDVIGFMGETGDASGCHVHFEVYGAVNPFAKN